MATTAGLHHVPSTGEPRGVPSIAVPAPAGEPALSLRQITRESVREICALQVAPQQSAQVASNAVSIAEAHFYGEEAWFRAICVGDEPVGFLMLYDPTGSVEPQESEFYLWRIMIDQRHQRRGYGTRAVHVLFQYAYWRRHATRLFVSHVASAPELGRWFAKLGFRPTGREEDGEVFLMRNLP